MIDQQQEPTKQCKGPCGQVLPLSSFSPKQSKCRDCRNAARREKGQTEEQKERIRERGRKFRKKNLEGYKAKEELYNKRRRLKDFKAIEEEIEENEALFQSDAIRYSHKAARNIYLSSVLLKFAEEIKELEEAEARGDLMTDEESRRGKKRTYKKNRDFDSDLKLREKSPDAYEAGQRIAKYHELINQYFEEWAAENPQPFPDSPLNTLWLELEYADLSDPLSTGYERPDAPIKEAEANEEWRKRGYAYAEARADAEAYPYYDDEDDG